MWKNHKKITKKTRKSITNHKRKSKQIIRKSMKSQENQ